MTTKYYYDNLDDFISHIKTAAVKDSDISRYAVIGDPVSHSVSPILHGIAYPDCKYYAVRVKAEELSKFCSAARQYLSGFNITVPHKQAIQQFLDKIDNSASKIDAVNTVLCKDGAHIGFNTDVYGIKAALMQHGMADSETAVIIGAGGAAKAAAAALTMLNIRFSIAARNIQKAQSELPSYNIIPLNSLSEVSAKLLINCTPVGMSSADIDATPVYRADMPSDIKNVYDTIYSPLTTKLLKIAESLGCNTANGLSMLIHQGLEAQKIWGNGADKRDYHDIHAALLAHILKERLQNRKKSIALCGFMGSGKSTVAKDLSNLTGIPLVETDREIEKKQGESIAQIFSKSGESHFRTLESAEIALADDGNIKILSLGGGAVIDAENVARLKDFCDIVYIDVPLNVALSRIEDAGNRPLINNDIANVAELYNGRLSIYRAAADIIVDGDAPIMKVAAEILTKLF